MINPPSPIVRSRSCYKIETLDRIALKVIVSSGGKLQDRADNKIKGRAFATQYLGESAPSPSRTPHPTFWKMTEEEITRFKIALLEISPDFIEYHEGGSSVLCISSGKDDIELHRRLGQRGFLKARNDRRYDDLLRRKQWLHQQRESNARDAAAIAVIAYEIEDVKKAMTGFKTWYITNGYEIPKDDARDDYNGSPPNPRIKNAEEQVKMADSRALQFTGEHVGSDTSKPKRREVELHEAGEACQEKKEGIWKNKPMIEICEWYLSRHSIRRKPEYTKEKLANYISRMHKDGKL